MYTLDEQKKILKKLKKGVNYIDTRQIGEDIQIKVFNRNTGYSEWVPVWTIVEPGGKQQQTSIKEKQDAQQNSAQNNTWESKVQALRGQNKPPPSDYRTKRRLKKRAQDGSNREELIKEAMTNNLTEEEAIKIIDEILENLSKPEKKGSKLGVAHNPVKKANNLASLIASMRY